MKKLVALLILVAAVFIYVNRYRLFIRDPLAEVSRDGLKVSDVKVLINYPSDVLLEDGSDNRQRLYLVQHWNLAVGTPIVALKCVQGLACLTDRDQATAAPVAAGSRGRRPAFEGVTMTDRRVEFVDEDGALVVVSLR